MTSTFRDAFFRSSNQMGFSILTVLAWLAGCDGNISEEEIDTLREIASNSKSDLDVAWAVTAARTASVADLQLASEVIKHLPLPARKLFMQMALGVALADGELPAPENHVLRYLADLLELGTELDNVFREMTGKPFPAAPDPSMERQEQHKDAGKQQQHDQSSEQRSDQSHQRGQGSSNANVMRIRALAILGLTEDATAEDIKLAFRRLARIHHPDRFTSLGSEAVQAATQTFQRIQGAYQVLTS